MEFAWQAVSRNLPEMSASVNEEVPIDGPAITNVSESVVPMSVDDRPDRWASIVERGDLRKRILHDIVPCNDEESTIRVFKRLSERIRNNPRGSGVMCISAHLDGPHSHVHIVHDCNWNSSSCKDVFLQGIPIKKRQARYNQWITNISAEFWRNLFSYLFGRGRR